MGLFGLILGERRKENKVIFMEHGVHSCFTEAVKTTLNLFLLVN